MLPRLSGIQPVTWKLIKKHLDKSLLQLHCKEGVKAFSGAISEDAQVSLCKSLLNNLANVLISLCLHIPHNFNLILYCHSLNKLYIWHVRITPADTIFVNLFVLISKGWSGDVGKGNEDLEISNNVFEVS